MQTQLHGKAQLFRVEPEAAGFYDGGGEALLGLLGGHGGGHGVPSMLAG